MNKPQKKQEEEKKTPSKQELATLQAAGQPKLPDTLSMDYLAADAGKGSSNVTQQDTATPLLVVLQGNSAQCKKSDGKYIPEAKEGMIYNNVTNELYDGDEGIIVTPAYFEKVYIEWKPNRGGFVAMHDVTTPLKAQIEMKDVKQDDGTVKQVPTLPNGNLFIETNQHYVLVINVDGSFEPAVIPMVSSGLQCSRKWNALIKKVMLTDSSGNMFNPASFSKMYKLVTKGRTKDKYSWMTWAVEPMGFVPERRLYEAAKAFEAAIHSGAVKLKQDVEPAEVVAGKDEGEDDKI